MNKGVLVAGKTISKPSVLICLYYYTPYVSGLTIYAMRLAEELVKEGYRVTVLTSRHDKKLPKKEVINGVEVLRRPVALTIGKGVVMPTFWTDIIRLAHKYDYVNAHLPMIDSGFASIFIPKSKQVTTYHCDLNLGTGIINRLIASIAYGFMHLQLMRSSVVIPSTTDYLEHSAMKRYGSKAHPIYPLVREDEFYPVAGDALFNRLGINKQEVRIGFVGRIVYEKGIEYLLGSIPYLAKKWSNFKIVLVGDYEKIAGGSVKAKLDGILAEYPDKIIFTGYLDDKERNQFYTGIDVLVLPSIDPLEAYGMVQVEAMLCGTPVVASDLPGVREVVLKSGAGRISKVKDSEDIAKQIIEVIENKEIYKPKRKEIIYQFGPKKTIALYKKLLDRKK